MRKKVRPFGKNMPTEWILFYKNQLLVCHVHVLSCDGFADAAGVIAKKWLQQRYGVSVRGYLSQLGPITPEGFDWSAVEDNPFFWPLAAWPASRR